MNLITDRLLLLPFTIQDDRLFFKINTHPYVRQYLWDDEVIARQTADQLLEKNESHFKQDQWGLWKIQLKGNSEIIGYAGLWHFFDESQPQLLYVLLPQYSGKGYATEASRAVVDYCFDSLGFQYLVASMDAPHDQSRRVCERLGMQLIEERVIDDKPTIFFRRNAETRDKS